MLIILSLFGCPEIALESVPLGIGLGGVEPTVDGGDRRWVVAGTVSGVENNAPEGDFDQIPLPGATAVVRIEVIDSGTAAFGWSSIEDLAVPVAVGDDVELVVAEKLVWGVGQNAVLRKGDGTLLAAFGIEGWGRAITTADLPEVSPVMGDEVDRMSDECGTQVGHEIDFGSRAVRPFGGSQITVGGADYTGWAFSAWDYAADSVTCSDVTGEFDWVVVSGFEQ